MEQAIPPTTRTRCSLEEYFELAEQSEEKLEYHDGEIVAMAGGTESHSLITTNVIGELRNRLKDNPCRVYDSNLRVSPAMRKKYYYPDALVVCGDRQLDPNDPRKITISNPTLIVEVMSDTTENFDRDKKFLAYLQAESLKEYVLIAQHTPRVVSYFRQPDGTWSFAFAEGKEAVARLRSLQIDLPLSEVYAKVELPVADEKSEPAQ
jgi:Uma2 family endonuclease